MLIEVEKMYQSFISSLSKTYDLNDIDFFGINFDSNGNVHFKIYFTQDASELIQDDFYSFLTEHDMIRYFESVTSSTDPTSLRMEYGLKNRFNNNINELFQFLEKNTRLKSSQLELAKRIASIKITNKENFDFSSLYFCSVEKQKNTDTKAKFHYYTRFCEEPDAFSAENSYMDDKYFQFINTLQNDKFNAIVQDASTVLKIPGTHLWMIGFDACSCGNKYKVYIKLPDRFSLMQLSYFSMFNKKITKQICNWTIAHDEYYLHGLALGVDDNDVKTVNLYYLRR